MTTITKGMANEAQLSRFHCRRYLHSAGKQWLKQTCSKYRNTPSGQPQKFTRHAAESRKNAGDHQRHKHGIVKSVEAAQIKHLFSHSRVSDGDIIPIFTRDRQGFR